MRYTFDLSVNRFGFRNLWLLPISRSPPEMSKLDMRVLINSCAGNKHARSRSPAFPSGSSYGRPMLSGDSWRSGGFIAIASDSQS